MTKVYIPSKNEICFSGTFAAMDNAVAVKNPSAFYFASDKGRMFRSNGAVWKAVAPYEVGHASKQVDQAPFAATVATAITNLTVSDTFDGGPITVELDMATRSDLANAICLYQIMEDGVQVQSRGVQHILANSDYGRSLKCRRQPAAGAHTYSVQCYAFTGNTTVKAAANQESFLRVEAF